ncbi:hypothetical protein V6N13_114124 [Hibiscus sabdariffa]
MQTDVGVPLVSDFRPATGVCEEEIQHVYVVDTRVIPPANTGVESNGELLVESVLGETSTSADLSPHVARDISTRSESKNFVAPNVASNDVGGEFLEALNEEGPLTANFERASNIGTHLDEKYVATLVCPLKNTHSMMT